MRSAEPALRAALLVALAVSSSGCAMRAETLQPSAGVQPAAPAAPGLPLYLNPLGIAHDGLGRLADAQQPHGNATGPETGCATGPLKPGLPLDRYLWNRRGAAAAGERDFAESAEGDATVRRWVAEIRRRRPQPQLAGMTERP